MAVLKYYDGANWEPVVSALQGPIGPTGATGPTGPTGVAIGLPTGGATGASLIKASSADYDTEWSSNVGGLVLIETATFSSVSTVNVNDVFSADYDDYEIYFYIDDLTSGGQANQTFRMRASGTDATTNYIVSEHYSYAGSNGSQSTGTASVLFGAFQSRGFLKISLAQPFLSARTSLIALHCRYQTDVGTVVQSRIGALHNTVASYDGFSLTTASSTYTNGRYSVFGVRK